MRKGNTGDFMAVANGAASAALALDVGANAVTVRVTVEDETTQDYFVTVTLAQQLGTNVPAGLCDGGEVKTTAADDGASPPTTLTVPAGMTEGRVNYPVADNGDDRVGRVECFALRASTDAPGWTAASDGADDVELGIAVRQGSVAFGNLRPQVVTVPDYAATVSEGDGTVTVPVTVSHLPASSTTVAVEVAAGQGGGTATEGTNAQNPGDFLIATESVAFGPSDASRTKNLSVAVTDDSDVEPGETIMLRLTTTGQTNYILPATGARATLTIADDDEPAPVAPADLRVASDDARLALSWTAPAGNDPSMAWVEVSRSGAVAPQTIAGLTNNTAYRVQVRAENRGGDSAWVHGAGTPRGAGTTPEKPAVRLSASPNPAPPSPWRSAKTSSRSKSPPRTGKRCEPGP